MSFAPFTEQHAIQSVKFGLLLNHEFTIETMNALARSHGVIRKELPAVSFDEGDEPSVTLAYLRPNGTRAWALRLSRHVAYVECNRYTRWDKVWGQAQRYLRAVAEHLPDADYHMIGLGLSVTDKFRTIPEDFDLKNLFALNDLMPNDAFNWVPPWEFQQTWMQRIKANVVMHALEIETRRAQRFSKKNDDRYAVINVTIDHSLELRREDPIDVRVALSTGSDAMSQDMTDLHLANKGLIDVLLASGMKERIGLWNPA